MKKKKNGLKIFLIVLCCIDIIASYLTIVAFVENQQIKQLVNDFKSQATQCEYSAQYDMNFCKVVTQKKDITPTFSYDPYGNLTIGSRGDLLVSLQGAVSPLINWFLDFYIGGHAAIIDGAPLDETDKPNEQGGVGSLIEITGLEPKLEDNVIQYGYNDWLIDTFLRNHFIALKVIAKIKQRIKAMQKAESMLGEPYNYTFVFNTKKTHYCSDILSKVYAVVDKDLNEDGFVTTVQDIITSQDTSIFLYKEINQTIKDENDRILGTNNVYYLDDGNDYSF